MKFTRIIAIVLAALIFITLSLASQQLPPFSQHSYPLGTHFLQNTLKEVGAWNIVNAILWDYRGYDTLGESTVLFTAIVVVLALFRRMKE